MAGPATRSPRASGCISASASIEREPPYPILADVQYQVGNLRHLEPPLRGHGGEARWHDHIGEPTGVRLSELVPGEPQHFTMAIFTSGLLPFGERRFVTVSGVDLVFEDARDRIQTLPLR